MTMDGLKLLLEQSCQVQIQNQFYNGWTHGHNVTNILGFCPSGTIVIATTNVPGCIHDSTVCEWGNIYEKLQKVYERTGGMVTVDSAFCRKKHNVLINRFLAFNLKYFMIVIYFFVIEFWNLGRCKVLSNPHSHPLKKKIKKFGHTLFRIVLQIIHW